MKKIFNYLDQIICVIAALLLMAIAALTFYQVFCRFVLNNASSWSEELVRYLFVWASTFGAAVGIRMRIHMGIDVVVNKFPTKVRTMIHLAVQLAIIAMCLFMIYYGIQLSKSTAMQFSPALHLSMKYVYSAAPVGGVLMIIYSLEVLFDDIMELMGRKEDGN